VKLQGNLVSENTLLLKQKRLVISAEEKLNEVSQDTNSTIYFRQRWSLRWARYSQCDPLFYSPNF